jgi:hypothetical protein
LPGNFLPNSLSLLTGKRSQFLPKKLFIFAGNALYFGRKSSQFLPEKHSLLARNTPLSPEKLSLFAGNTHLSPEKLLLSRWIYLTLPKVLLIVLFSLNSMKICFCLKPAG